MPVVGGGREEGAFANCGFVRGILCGAVFARECLQVVSIVGRFSEVTHEWMHAASRSGTSLTRRE